MSIEIRPFGDRCNLACRYCYENHHRSHGGCRSSYDLNAIRATVERLGSSFTLFGGEPLLMPEADLEELWAWGLKKFGSNSIQTNGTLIADTHIVMFRQYNVNVGISIDGPGELNDLRWAGTLAKTRTRSEQTEDAIERVVAAGITPWLIITLHRQNATAERFAVMDEWLRHLDRLGLRAARLHVLQFAESSLQEKYGLSIEENCAAFVHLAKLEESDLKTLRFDVLVDMEALLRASDEQCGCVWHACDPYVTDAVQGVEADGSDSHCVYTEQDNISFVRCPTHGYERYLALYETAQDSGGCQGCRFFAFCKGQCPGSALDDDWRNKSRYCELWRRLFTHVEDRLISRGILPLSQHANLWYLEQEMLRHWRSGRNLTIKAVLADMNAQYAEKQKASSQLPGSVAVQEGE